LFLYVFYKQVLASLRISYSGIVISPNLHGVEYYSSVMDITSDSLLKQRVVELYFMSKAVWFKSTQVKMCSLWCYILCCYGDTGMWSWC